MAKAQTGRSNNMSQAIREVYLENPGMKPKEIQEVLAGRGIEVKQNLVYIVISKMKDRTTRKKKQKFARAAKAAVASGNTSAVQTIMKVKALAQEVGGYDALKDLIDVLTS